MHQNNIIMEAVNTRIFSLFELKYKKYGNLINFVDGLLEVTEEFEITVEAMEELQLKGELTPELEVELNMQVTQLDYLHKNIETGLEAMRLHENKAFVQINDVMVCQN